MRNCLIILYCLLPLTASAQNDLQVKGNLSGLATNVLLVDAPGKGVYDTVVVRNGNFEFSLPMTSPNEISVMEEVLTTGYMRRQISLYGIPGENVTISGTFDDYELGGSPFYRQLNKVKALERPFKQEEKQNITWGSVMRDDPRMNQDEISKQFHQKRTDIINRLEDASVKYMTENPNDEAALLLLQNIRDAHKSSKAYNAMSEQVRNGRMAAWCLPYVDRFTKEIARLKVAEGIQPGKVAPLFTLNDLQGNPLSLKSLRGKYVVLDFWGSWCFWCLNGVPQTKKYYDKYQGRFEILGIDENDTEEKWKQAVEKNQMNWLHVRNTKSDHVPQLYAVSGYPTKVIINPDGTINRVFVGEKEEFYEYLDELFRK
ncbi:MAG: AhpC/TSA family protein [Prevotella sp.]|nr:AhpC/TSA family protein [Prevotella sp.]MBR1463386.1 AhpC/TSA family protein [Prevotella sp.]